MVSDLGDFCTWMYVIVDGVWQQIAPFLNRPGSAPGVGDTELIPMAVVGERRGWDKETELINNCRKHTDLLPLIPERSRFNRRSRNLALVRPPAYKVDSPHSVYLDQPIAGKA